MLSVQELFYGEAEPVWIINTAAAQVIRHHPEQKPVEYIIDHCHFPQYATEQPQFQQFASHRESLSQMGYSYQLLQENPLRQSLLDESRQQNHDNLYQKKLSYQPADEAHQYLQHNQERQQRNYGPLQPISPQDYHQNIRDAPPNYSFGSHVRSAPSPMHAHPFNTQQENFSRRTMPETQLLRLKVPMCCEACAERVVCSLSTMKGVYSVECDVRKEKVTVTASAAPADILKACKKLFKKSEMWIDRYY